MSLLLFFLWSFLGSVALILNVCKPHWYFLVAAAIASVASIIFQLDWFYENKIKNK